MADETEKTLQQQYDELKADRDGAYASLHPLQVRLDEALQREVDLRAAHAAELEALQAAHAEALRSQAETLAGQHAAEIAALKEKVLVPAMRDLHARQAADLAAAQAKQLADL